MVPMDAGDNLAFKIPSNFFTKSEPLARYRRFSVSMLHVSPSTLSSVAYTDEPFANGD